jgi:hypothetical protein
MSLPGDLWWNQLLLLAWLEEENDGENGQFYCQLDEEGYCCCFGTLLVKLYAACHDPALITVTGLDYDCFAKLMGLFRPYFYGFTPWTLDRQIKPRSENLRGRKQIVDIATWHALLWPWCTCIQGVQFMLQAFFGLIAMPLVMWKQFGKQIIIKILQNLADIHIKMPTTNWLFQHASIIECA